MELLYNPDVMPEEEVKATFVARGALLDELVSLVAGQPDGAGVQHAVIIAPRGMGKTTMLRMVQFAVKDRGLADRWLALKFPEESYGVYDLADLWLETLDLIAAETKDNDLRQRAQALKEKYPSNDDLQEAALAALKDWRRRDGRRLLLLVENFDEMLGQINDERDNARLRDVLMNDGTMMLLGGATTFFKEACAYDQPLYNFFKIYNLADLRFAEMQDLLRRRAEVDSAQDFEVKLKANANRLRALEYFTGGNPRLVLMLYRLVSRSALTEVRQALEKLLDEVTPYYKAKVEALPPQQRKILDHIARVSGQTNEGLTPGDIAKAVRLSPNQVSAQLKRLLELGYVRAANLRGRSSYYTLSEPLYAIWHQMRFGRDSRLRMQWLVNWLRVMHSPEELIGEGQRLDEIFQQHLDAGRHTEARGILEYLCYLADASADSTNRMGLFERVFQGFLRLKDVQGAVNELIRLIGLENLSAQALVKLCEAKVIREGDYRTVALKSSEGSLPKPVEDYLMCSILLLKAAEKVDAESTLAYVEQLIKTAPELQRFRPEDSTPVRTSGLWHLKGALLLNSGKYSDALDSFDKAVKESPELADAWKSRGQALFGLHLYSEAVGSYDIALGVEPNNAGWWGLRGLALESEGKKEQALASFERSLEIDSRSAINWHIRGRILMDLGRDGEALTSFDKSLEFDPGYQPAWVSRSLLLYGMERYEDAIKGCDNALELDVRNNAVWAIRGLSYLQRFTRAVERKDLVSATEDWNEAIKSMSKSSQQDWHGAASGVLLSVAKTGDLSYVRRLITVSGMEEPFFSLARAIDFLLTGDEVLIEKLSPEVRGVVEETVARLRPAAQKAARPPAKSRAGKSKPDARR
jgi:tetratricopeptide (TPR) repeat protein/DNA-binding transcriptional ArsR family regulator